MSRVNPENCEALSENDLRLDATTINQLPTYNKIPVVQWFANRTKLLHIHNVALNRGFFYSYILQRLNTTLDSPLYLPMLMYYYFSAAADVSSGPGWLNISAVLYDTNTSYAGWFTNKDINTTLPLFGPYAQRIDDWNDELNFLREPSNNTIVINDLGAGPNSNYTAPWYKNNPYIRDKEMGINFIPDYRGSSRDKSAYTTEIQLATIRGDPVELRETRTFFGPNAPGEKETSLPVLFTKPYFDCGRNKTNRWIVSAVSSVTDYMPRYSFIDRLRGPRRVAITLMSMDFLLIDFNPCPPGPGNDDYFLAGTARCKPSTMCIPISGFGFQRGGYECVCKGGYRLPVQQVGPFRGIDIEQATITEYENNFDCIPVGWRQVWPQNDGDGTIRTRRSASLLDVPKAALSSMLSVPGNLIKSSLSKLNLVGQKTETELHYLDDSHGRSTPENPKTRMERQNKTMAKMIQQSQQFLTSLTASRSQQGVPTMLRSKFDLPDLMVETSDVCPLSNHSLQEDQTPKVRVKRSVNKYDEVNAKEGIKWYEKPFYHLPTGSVFDMMKFDNVHNLLEFVKTTNEKNCMHRTPDSLKLAGEISYGVDKQFETEGRVALRLAHFLSAYYQNNIKGQLFGSLRSGFSLNRYQMFGEVMANVLGSFEIVSSGIFFDRQ
ncbi:hypothetical protein Ciccas_007426, partial [Cichlidogyrus casuarinus]